MSVLLLLSVLVSVSVAVSVVSGERVAVIALDAAYINLVNIKTKENKIKRL